MLECRCGEFVSADRRTCPNGHVVNPEGKDPPVQKESRPGAALANLRSENLQLQKSVEEQEKAAKRSADQAALLQQSLDELGEELGLLTLEQRQLRDRLRDLEERSRILRSRFEALGASTYRPFSAEQAPMFGPALHSDVGSEQAG